MMKCDCKDWAESIEEERRVFTQAHLKGIESYKGKEFTYCPYCGEGLVPDYKGCAGPTSGYSNTQGKYLDVPTSSDEFALRKDR